MRSFSGGDAAKGPASVLDLAGQYIVSISQVYLVTRYLILNLDSRHLLFVGTTVDITVDISFASSPFDAPTLDMLTVSSLVLVDHSRHANDRIARVSTAPKPNDRGTKSKSMRHVFLHTKSSIRKRRGHQFPKRCLLNVYGAFAPTAPFSALQPFPMLANHGLN